MPIILYAGNPTSVPRGLSCRYSPASLTLACYTDLLWSQDDEGPFVDILYPRCPICGALIPYDTQKESWLEHNDDHSTTVGVLRRCPCCCTVFIPEQSDMFSTLSPPNSSTNS